MSNRSREHFDEFFRPIFFAAFGNRCVACGAEGPLQMGHVQRREDGGPATLDNLQPLCAECNGRHNKNFSMEDWRPDGWRDTFLKLVAQALRTEIRVVYPDPKNGIGSPTLDAQNALENAAVIGWEKVKFVFNSALSHALSTQPYPLAEYRSLVALVISKGTQHEVPIPPPTEDCQSKLCNLVRKLGRNRFLAAAQEFLLQEKWFDDWGQRRRVMQHPWQTFADNVELYLAQADERARQIARLAAAERARQIEEEKERQAAIARDRWKMLRYAADTPDWPGLAADDKEFLAAIRALPDEQQTVSDEDRERAANIASRYQDYWRRTKKYQLLQGIEHMKSLMLGSEYHSYQTWADDAIAEFHRLEELVRAASDNGAELEAYKQALLQLPKTKRE